MKRALTISHRQSSSPPEKLIPQRRRDPADLRDPPLMGHKMMINIAIMARTSTNIALMMVMMTLKVALIQLCILR